MLTVTINKSATASGLCMLLAALTLLGGCTNVDFDKMRADHSESFTAELAEKTHAAIASGELSLEDCIEIALDNNLDLSIAEIDRRLAGFDTKIAFSNFLPQIDVGLNYHDANHQQQIGSHGSYNAMGDKSVTSMTIDAQQAIFMPETWFLYDAYRKGEGVSELVARRTRQLIRLQVTGLYYSCLSLEQARAAIESSLAQAKALAEQVDSLYSEGMAMPSEIEQVKTLVESQRLQLRSNERQQRQIKAALLEAMGLSPSAEISLTQEEPIKLEQMDLADQILQAMLLRPELGVADRTIEIRKDQTRMAIAQFLPKLVGFSDFTHSSDSFLKYSNVWSYGVSGTLSVFDGFANIYEYKAARQRETQAAMDRERQCLSIMLEVVNARSQYDQAVDTLALANQQLKAADVNYDEVQARWTEGLIDNAQRLEAISQQAVAMANANNAEFQLRVSAATLADVMGKTPEGCDK